MIYFFFFFQAEDGIRDVAVTGVQTCALPISSIMSKKLAEGIDALVLDVKTGSGAFMKKEEDSARLAQVMVETGKRMRSEEHTSELQSRLHLVCRLLLEKKKITVLTVTPRLLV